MRAIFRAATRSPLLRLRFLSSGCGTDIHSTTIVCVKKNGVMAMVGDGQMSMGSMIVKPNAKKVRRIGKDDGIMTGFAGATADAMTLLDRLERKLEEFPNQLLRSCVELAKGWRTDKYLRRLEAMMIVADGTTMVTLTGNGDVLEPHDGVIAIGSGGPYALAAARALLSVENELSAEEIAVRARETRGRCVRVVARPPLVLAPSPLLPDLFLPPPPCARLTRRAQVNAMTIAGDICVYTNHNFVIETIDVRHPSKFRFEPRPARPPCPRFVRSRRSPRALVPRHVHACTLTPLPL